MSVFKFPIIIFSLLFLFLIPSTFSLSFNLSSISAQDTSHNINVTGDAYISNQGIQVTPDERNTKLGSKTGRATYVKPLHLWDKASGNLADFSTHFSFVIDSRGRTQYGDGLAFFLAPFNSSLLPGTAGGGLGLGRGVSSANSSSESFVAVEFDTFQNTWDPYFPHVGIDINSVNSVKTVTWENNITQGMQNDAWIIYNASSKTLRVDFTGFDSNIIQQGNLSFEVDLRVYLPEYVAIGFSAATGDLFQKNNVKSWDFFSSLKLDITPEEPITPSPEPAPVAASTGRGRSKNRVLVVGLSSVGISILILSSAFASYCLWKRKNNNNSNNKNMESGDEDSMDNEFEKGTGPRKFSYSELLNATDKFAEDKKLGEGGFGGVYRGFSRKKNSEIAVKKVSGESHQGLKEYASEVKIISQLRHRNLVQLIGWCHKGRDLLLVYEFMPNGSLDFHLFKGRSLLAWETRYRIAQGLASALLYLHEAWERCVVHRDIKASNIMLDSNFNAKLGDFGLARLVDHEKGSQTTVVAGTMGYIAPECTITGRASKESDVYSFGIVLLEIACGRKAIDHRCKENEQVILVEWVWSLYGTGQLFDAADPKLVTEFDAREMECLMVVGLWCAHPDNTHRPSIRQAIHVLNFEGELPVLPPTRPLPTYDAPISRVTSSSGYSVTHNSYSNTSNLTSSSAGSATALLAT